MIKPFELDSVDGRDTWDTIVAASTGDVATLRQLLARDPRLARAQYWYLPAVHFAAREGHAEAVHLLLQSGADPEQNGLHDRNLIEMARERGHEQIARMLEQERERLGRVAAQSADHPIHRAAARGEIDAVRAFLDTDATLVDRGSRRGATPLHCAVLGASRQMVSLLLDRGANIHARNPDDLQAIDFAIWGERRPSVNEDMVRLLVSRGATYDLTIAAALGSLAGVRRMLDNDPSRIRETRPNGRRPLSAAVEFGRDDIARLLLERGANPRWEPAEAVHSASGLGNFAMVKLLLDHGANPDPDPLEKDYPGIIYFAVEYQASPEIIKLLLDHGARPDLRMPSDPAYAQTPEWPHPWGCNSAQEAVSARMTLDGRGPPGPADQVAVLKLLMEHGADPLQLDSRGKCALSIAQDLRRPDLVHAIEDYLSHAPPRN